MIRPWTEADAEASFAVYVDAVRNGTSTHYNAAQRLAWAPSKDMEAWWPPRLAEDSAWVAEDARGLTGVIALRPDGYLDLFFVLPRARGDGTAAALYETLLGQARKGGLTPLTTHASDYLKPFLERRGWRVLAEESVDRHGATLRRWDMALDQVPGSQAS